MIINIKRCKDCNGFILPVLIPRKGRRPEGFCSTDCRTRYNARRAQRGAIIYDLAMLWRKTRSKQALTDLCGQISFFIQADNDDGRQTWNDYSKANGGVPWHHPSPEPFNPKMDKDDIMSALAEELTLCEREVELSFPK